MLLFRVTALLGLPLLLAPAAPAAPTFTDISNSCGAAGSWETCGVAAADIDNDGDLDLATTAVGGGSSRIYRNDGTGLFADVANSGTGGESQTALFGDVDNDGFTDLYHGLYFGGSRLFRGTGAAIPFTDVTAASGTGVSSTWTGNAFADVDLDGDLDLFLARGGGNCLFINNGAGVFSDQAAARGVQDAAVGCHAVAFGDVDGDGDVDLFLGRDLGNAPRLYLNDGTGYFTDAASGAGLLAATSARSAVFGDIDNDGDLDLFTVSWFDSYLFRNDGSGVFTNISAAAGVGGRGGQFGVAFGDYDNDGDLDLVAAGGEIGGGSLVNLLFRNDGGNVFTEVAAAEGVQDIATEHRGSIFLDIDNDGDLELFIGRKTPADGNKDRMYRNETGGTAWLKVRATGTLSNRSAIGTKIWIYEAGHLGDPAYLRGFREVSAGSGQASCPPAEQHFGLSALATLDLRVRFPSGNQVEQTSVAAGQILTIPEPPTLTVTLVDSTAAAGSYGPGAILPITIRFSSPVVVTGTPRLTLETGASDAVVDFSSGSGTRTLTFVYTVANGHLTPALDCTSTTSLALNGGSIGSATGYAATLTLPVPGSAGSLSAQRTIVLTATPPSPPGTDITLESSACGAIGVEFLLLFLPLALLRRARLRRLGMPLVLCLMALLGNAALAQEAPPPQEPELIDLTSEPAGMETFVALRAGGSRFPEFDALTAQGRRTIDSGVLFDAGLDAGMSWSGFLVFATVDLARSPDLDMFISGLHAGLQWPWDEPHREPPFLRGSLSAGVLYGTLETDESAFGEFEAAIGFQIRAAVSLQITSALEAGLWLEVRHLGFEYEDDVIQGDRSAGGVLPTAGLSLGFRF